MKQTIWRTTAEVGVTLLQRKAWEIYSDTRPSVSQLLLTQPAPMPFQTLGVN